MEEKDLQIQMQAYLENSLSEEEAAVFEKELNRNKDLQKDFELLKDIEEELGNKDLLVFKEELSKIVKTSSESEEPQQEEGRIIPLWRRMLSIAASLLIIALAGWWLVNQSTDVDDLVALADEHLVHYPAQLEVRGKEDKTAIYDNYEAKQYAIAAKNLEEIGNKNKDQKALFFASISYLNIDNPKKAIAILSNLDKTPFLSNKINYYLGIAHLKLGEKEKAIVAFGKMNASDQFLYDKAKLIVEKIQ
jgi:tetratricopeptide (TPR) repeat protein